MPHPVNQPFPRPAHPPLELKLGARAIQDYVAIFERRRGERPGRKFADADIFEILRMAEHRGKVSRMEIRYINKGLLRDRVDFFSNEAQKTRLRILVQNHRLRNEASKKDEFVESILELAPMPYFRKAEAADFIGTAQDLSSKINESRSYYAEHGSDDPDLVAAVNQLSSELSGYVKGLTLSDLDKAGKKGRSARRRDAANFFRRLDGRADHEAKWDPKTKTWMNWNRDIIPARS